MKNFLLPLFLLFLATFSFQTEANATHPDEPEKQTKVLISTEYGNITVVLYNETPLHRDNFIKIVKEGVLDSTLFHRVIKSFMIQGGDPDSKKAASGTLLGNGGLPYTVKAEIKPGLLHKKGALSAARQPDNVNPNKESSSTQFYIVQGQVFDDEGLKKMEARINQMTQNAIFFELLEKPEYKEQKERFNKARDEQDQMATMQLYLEMQPKILEIVEQRGGQYIFTDEQKEIYKTVGGAPHLDGNYTVFGEVIEGLEVIDKIAEEKVDANNRPLKDVRMTVKIISE